MHSAIKLSFIFNEDALNWLLHAYIFFFPSSLLFGSWMRLELTAGHFHLKLPMKSMKIKYETRFFFFFLNASFCLIFFIFFFKFFFWLELFVSFYSTANTYSMLCFLPERKSKLYFGFFFCFFVFCFFLRKSTSNKFCLYFINASCFSYI